MAFTLSDAADGRLRSGEPVEDAVSALLALSDHAGDRCRDHDGEDAGGVEIEAVLFNCCSSMAVQVAIRAVRSTPHPRSASDLIQHLPLFCLTCVVDVPEDPVSPSHLRALARLNTRTRRQLPTASEREQRT